MLHIKNKNINYLFLSSFLVVALLFSSCEKDDPTPPNEEELITTLSYILTPVGGGTPITLTFQDLDGDGGNPPTITGGTLALNATYDGVLEILNEAENPVEDITAEILAEDIDHQFFFETTVTGLTINYADQDYNGNPLGLMSSLSTYSAGSGDIKITLRHEPDKTAAGVAMGDITNAGGETDIEVTFPVNVQ
ncbi:MAG: type 1 periplasmic binding fold superfamily protein [Bacteroidia bacterium]|nr:type 1 periplasmic binding fold superfamily protein [Bacteroidia bacterium]